MPGFLEDWKVRFQEQLDGLRGGAVTVTYGAFVLAAIAALPHIPDTTTLLGVLQGGGLTAAGGVTGSLIAAQLEHWRKRRPSAQEIEEAARDKALREGLVQLLQMLGAQGIPQPGLTDDDRAWFVETLRNEMRRIERALATQVPLNTIPTPTLQFVGRGTELETMHRELREHQTLAICTVSGLGGVGKTQLAYEYAREYATEYPGGRFLLHGEGIADVRVPFSSLAAALELELSPAVEGDPSLVCARVKQELARRGVALLLLDNVDQSALLTGGGSPPCPTRMCSSPRGWTRRRAWG
jgi:hypothetical protein